MDKTGSAILNPLVLGFRCMICGTEYPADFSGYVCPKHTGVLANEGILDVIYDYTAAKKVINKESLATSLVGQIPGQAFSVQGMWRYRAMLPLGLEAEVPPLLVGDTPLYAAPRLAKTAQVSEVYIKDDGRLPTASFKDRASALGVALAKARGFKNIATASTGNAAAALAGMAAAMDFPATIFVPATAPPAKIAQLLAYGAKVYAVNGSYDQAFDLCMQACAKEGWYNRNTGYNPYMAEGKKTCSYEICQQLHWQAPDVIFVSVGDGCIISGIYKGLYDLKELGLITHLPKIYGIQAAGSDFMTQAFENNEDVLTKQPIPAQTIADSISAGLPRDRLKAMVAVKASQGRYLRVSDAEILAAIPDLAQHTGVFAEPAAAAAWAGVLQAKKLKLLQPSDKIVVISTGSGLKDVAAAVKACDSLGRSTISIDPLS